MVSNANSKSCFNNPLFIYKILINAINKHLDFFGQNNDQ